MVEGLERKHGRVHRRDEQENRNDETCAPLPTTNAIHLLLTQLLHEAYDESTLARDRGAPLEQPPVWCGYLLLLLGY